MSRKNISLNALTEQSAKEIMKARKIPGPGYSALLDILVREEYERRQPPTIYPTHRTGHLTLNETAASHSEIDQISSEQKPGAKAADQFAKEGLKKLRDESSPAPTSGKAGSRTPKSPSKKAR